MSALSLDKFQGGIVRNSGSLEATGKALRGGKIVLEASDLIDNSGSIRADAGADGSPAGRITLSAPLVQNTGLISASATPAGVADMALGAGAISIIANQFIQSASGKLDVSAFG